MIESGGVADLHYNKIQLAKSTNTDWSKVIVNAYVRDWTGNSKRLFFGQCYKNNSTYGSGILIFACDEDFSNPTQTSIINWSGYSLDNIKKNVKGLQILPERTIVIDEVICGYLSVEVNWDAIPDGWNAAINPKYYLEIETKPWEKLIDDEIHARIDIDTKINNSLSNQVPYIANSLPMVKKTSNLQ